MLSSNISGPEPAAAGATAAAPSIALEIAHLTMIYARGRTAVHALDEITLSVRDREFVAIVGPSGCGKSTLLKLISGLRLPNRGAIRLYGRAVEGPRKDVGIVFQSPILLAWRTVLENVMLPIDVLGLPQETYRRKAVALLELVGLGGFADMYPQELSGGMQQRAAIARALVYDAPLLLMDEPFGALDAMTREQMNLELQRIWSAQRKTVVFITHSIAEAVFLADRMVVMSPRPGRILKIIDNPMPRARTLDDMLKPEFGELVRQVRGLLGGQAGGEL
ncbi:MAG: ABC transporter ATP-binding protein [Proteobacteria bacterium]|nr:ABC transporter ATP-binding protein [Pseudomonadota bacterium]